MIRTIAIVSALAFVTPAFAQGATPAQPAAGGMAASSMSGSGMSGGMAAKDSKMAAKPKAKDKAKTTDAMAKDAKPATAAK